MKSFAHLFVYTLWIGGTTSAIWLLSIYGTQLPTTAAVPLGLFGIGGSIAWLAYTVYLISEDFDKNKK